MAVEIVEIVAVVAIVAMVVIATTAIKAPAVSSSAGGGLVAMAPSPSPRL